MRRLHRIQNWYFTGAISSGDRSLLANYRCIVNVLKEFGRVPSEHIVDDDALAWAKRQKRLGLNVYAYDFKGLDSSIALVGEFSLPTSGGGAEVDYSVRSGRPTLLVHESTRHASWYITDWAAVPMPPPNLRVEQYSSLSALKRTVRAFCRKTLQEHPPLPGAYIVIEGGDGCGKTRQRELLNDYLCEKGHTTIVKREPGGTGRAEAIRNMLLNPDEKELMPPEAELFLFEAARAILRENEIKPALQRGDIFLSDRNYYSTDAYQGFGRQMGLHTIDVLNNVAMAGIKPDLSFIIDVDPRVALNRATIKNYKSNDRIEKEAMEFHERVRQGYLEVARREANAHIIPYVPGGIDEMQAKIRAITDKFFSENFK